MSESKATVSVYMRGLENRKVVIINAEDFNAETHLSVEEHDNRTAPSAKNDAQQAQEANRPVLTPVIAPTIAPAVVDVPAQKPVSGEWAMRPQAPASQPVSQPDGLPETTPRNSPRKSR